MRGEWLRTLNEEITLDCKRFPCNVCGHQDINGECRHKVIELVTSKHGPDAGMRALEQMERRWEPVTLVDRGPAASTAPG